MGEPGGLPSMGSQSWTQLKRLNQTLLRGFLLQTLINRGRSELTKQASEPQLLWDANQTTSGLLRLLGESPSSPVLSLDTSPSPPAAHGLVRFTWPRAAFRQMSSA